MSYLGVTNQKAVEMGLFKQPNHTKTKRVFTIPLVVEVEAEQDYIDWLKENLDTEIDVTALLDDGENGVFIPKYFGHLDDELWCDHPHNYPHAAYCEGPTIKATLKCIMLDRPQND